MLAVVYVANTVDRQILMWETDYPHPTSQYPSPNSTAVHPADYAQATLGNVPEETVRKVLQDTAARIYGVEV